MSCSKRGKRGIVQLSAVISPRRFGMRCPKRGKRGIAQLPAVLSPHVVA